MKFIISTILVQNSQNSCSYGTAVTSGHSLLMFTLNPSGVICEGGGYVTDQSVKAINLMFAWQI